jgi:hypothetical protein
MSPEIVLTAQASCSHSAASLEVSPENPTVLWNSVGKLGSQSKYSFLWIEKLRPKIHNPFEIFLTQRLNAKLTCETVSCPSLKESKQK